MNDFRITRHDTDVTTPAPVRYRPPMPAGTSKTITREITSRGIFGGRGGDEDMSECQSVTTIIKPYE